MKTTILYVLTGLLAIAAGTFAYQSVQKNAILAERERTIVRLEHVIKELAQQEAVAIHITNEFKSTSVLGKTIVDAKLTNNAEQVATILKGELKK